MKEILFECALDDHYLFRFLYTGEYPSQEMTPNQIDLLISLGRECGVPNLLEVGRENPPPPLNSSLFLRIFFAVI